MTPQEEKESVMKEHDKNDHEHDHNPKPHPRPVHPPRPHGS
jgi:hypothetical protein